jgi:hypothetical protein
LPEPRRQGATSLVLVKPALVGKNWHITKATATSSDISSAFWFCILGLVRWTVALWPGLYWKSAGKWS